MSHLLDNCFCLHLTKKSLYLHRTENGQSLHLTKHRKCLHLTVNSLCHTFQKTVCFYTLQKTVYVFTLRDIVYIFISIKQSMSTPYRKSYGLRLTENSICLYVLYRKESVSIFCNLKKRNVLDQSKEMSFTVRSFKKQLNAIQSIKYKQCKLNT